MVKEENIIENIMKKGDKSYENDSDKIEIVQNPELTIYNTLKS